MDFFSNLGATVGRLWKERSYGEHEFPQIALRVLRNTPPSEYVSLWDVVRWGLGADLLPQQTDIEAKFGQPPLTVFAGRDFRIEVLFWVQGIPAIHQHGFSGAFHVLHGSSLHTLWRFDPRHEISSRLLFGSVVPQEAELLKKGESREIVAGMRMIHATYHLDRPTATVVIRTNREAHTLPQYAYLPPSIAYDDQEISHATQRTVQLLNMLLLSRKLREYSDAVRHLIATADQHTLFHALLATYTSIHDEGERHSVIVAASLRHPELMNAMTPALEYLDRRDRILSIRASVTNSDLQFFLALLLNVPHQQWVLKLIQSRYPSRDAIAAIEGWFAELCRLGVAGLQFNAPSVLMLRCLLRGLNEDAIENDFRRFYRLDDLRQVRNQLTELSSALKNLWILKPLLQCDSAAERVHLETAAA
jgi:hypothetical protein